MGEWQNQITCLLKLYLVGSYLPHLSIRSNIMPHEDNYNIYHKRKKKQNNTQMGIKMKCKQPGQLRFTRKGEKINDFIGFADGVQFRITVDLP